VQLEVRIIILILVIHVYSLFLCAKSAATAVIFKFSTVIQKVKQNSTEIWNIYIHVWYSAV
jgi:hypothetical protein